MVNYSLAHMSTKPGVENAPKKYYAKAQANGEITMDEIARTSHTPLLSRTVTC